MKRNGISQRPLAGERAVVKGQPLSGPCLGVIPVQQPVQQADNASQQDDDAILQEIFSTLSARVRADPYAWDGVYAMQIRGLPPGLRAMAATHDLVVGLSKGDFVWYFRHCGEPNHVQETERGLRELGLVELAELFREALAIIRPYLPEIRRHGDSIECLLSEGYWDRVKILTREAARLNAACGEQASGSAVYAAWIPYARAHPTGLFAE